MRMPTVENLLRLVQLEAGYGGAAIVRGIDLSVVKGRMITFVGPNGAGKSTLLRAIHGSAKVYSGSITYATHGKIEQTSPLDRLKLGIAFVPQGRCNFGQMSVAENLTISAHSLPAAKRRAATERVTALFPALRSRLRTLAGNLSGGEQQMLEMSMVLLSDPQCLLVDEPSLGLSPKMQEDVFAKLAALRDQGMTIIAVEQNVRAAMAVSDEAAVLVQGEIVIQGPSAEVNNDERIRKAYLGG